MNRLLVRCASGVSGGSTPAVFSTGKVSPGQGRFVDEQVVGFQEQAVGREDAARAQQHQVARHDLLRGELRRACRRAAQVALTCTIRSSFWTASAAPCSCQKPSRPLIRTIARMMHGVHAVFEKKRQAGREDQDQNDRAFELRQQQKEGGLRAPLLHSRAAGPRFWASAAVSPWGVVCSAVSRSAAGTLQNRADFVSAVEETTGVGVRIGFSLMPCTVAPSILERAYGLAEFCSALLRNPPLDGSGRESSSLEKTRTKRP